MQRRLPRLRLSAQPREPSANQRERRLRARQSSQEISTLSTIRLSISDHETLRRNNSLRHGSHYPHKVTTTCAERTVAVAILANPESSGCRTLQTPFRRPADAFAKAPAFNSASCFAEF